jgi:prolyl-tRNA synthetase
MNATFTDKDGQEKPFIMGCYGIGISRTAAAAVERHHDEFGIKWPEAIAPYMVIIVPVSDQDEQQMNVAEDIYNRLQKAGVEVILDDRPERAGVKLKDADLIGIPYRITVGKTIKDGLVEFKTRTTNETITITPEEAISKFIK